MGDQQLDLKFQEALIQSSQNLQVSLERYNSLLEKVVGNFEDINKQEDELNIKLEKTQKTLKTKIATTLKDIGKGLLDIAKQPLAKIFSVGYIIELAKKTMDHQRAIKDLSFRMGEAGKSAGQLSASMFNVAKNLGSSTSEALEFVEGLKKLRVGAKDITELGTAAGMFARLTGVANDQAIALTGNLVRMGGLGAKATTSILTSMTQMQRQVGLTEADMGTLTDTIVESTRMLGQMDKSAAQIENFNKGVIKLAGGFTKVGISVEKAADLVDKLLDPGSIEDNALLYAKLGVSIQDVVEGNVDMASLQGKMKSFGQDMKNMSAPAAAALAKQMGMTLKDARALADMPMDEGISQAGKSMSQMYDEQRTIQDKMMSVWNRIGTFLEERIMTPLFKLLDGGNWKKIAIILGIGLVAALLLFRKKMLGVATDFGQTVATATTEALGMSAKKAATVKEAQAGMGGRGASSGLMARVEAGPGYKQAQGTGEIFKALAQSDVFPKVAKMTQNVAEWYNYIAMGSKPLSLIGVLSEQMNAKLKDRVSYLSQEALMLDTAYEVQQKTLQGQREAYEGRLKELSVIKEKTVEQKWELNYLTKKVKGFEKEEDQLQKERNRIEDLSLDRMKTVVNRMLPDAKAQYAAQLKTEQDLLIGRTKGLETRRADLQLQASILDQERTLYQAEYARLANKANRSIEETKTLNEIQKRMKEIGNEGNEINEGLAETNVKLKTEEDTARRIAKEMKIVGDAATPSGALATSAFRRMGNFIKSALHAGADTVGHTFEKVKNSFSIIAKDIGAKLNPANWIKGAIGKNREKAEKESNAGMSKLGGVLGKVAGIALGVLTTLGVMEPLQKVFAAIMKGLKPMIDILMKAILPIFLKLFAAMMPLFAMLVNTFLPPLMILLGYLVKLLGFLIKGIAILADKLGAEKFGAALDEIAVAMDNASNSLITTGKKYMKEKLITDDMVQSLRDGILQVADNTAPEKNTEGATAGSVTAKGGATTVNSKPIYGSSSTPTANEAAAGATAATATNTAAIANATGSQTQTLVDIKNGIDRLVAIMSGGGATKTPVALNKGSSY